MNLHHWGKHINLYIIALLIFLLFYIGLASAQINDCEKLAKDYQKIHGGDLILIQPLKDNGAWDFGAYNGHFLNKAYSKERGIYYYDSQTNQYFQNISIVLDWYEWNTNKDAKLFDVNQDVIPFGIIWHY